MAAAACAGRRTASRNRRRTRGRIISAAALGRAWGRENARYCRRILDPPLRLGPEVRAARGGELVVARAPTVLGLPPVGLDGAALLEPDECVVERAVLDAQLAAGAFFEPRGDLEPVHGAPVEGPQHEDAECPANEWHPLH